MKWKFVLLAVGSLALSACGSHDCSSSDVRKTLLGLIGGESSGIQGAFENSFGVGSSKESLAAFAAGKVSEIVTLQKDKSTGAYVCNAKVSVQIPEGDVVSLQMNYEVRQVESGDSDFQVLANRSDINSLRATVNGAINRLLGEKAEAARKAQEQQAYRDHPPVALSDDEARTAMIEDMRRSYYHIAEMQHAIVGEDMGGHGYKDYVIVYRDEIGGGAFSWQYKRYSQHAESPGAPTRLRGSQDESLTREHEISNIRLQGGVLTVSDGSGWSQAVTFERSASYSPPGA